MSIGKDPRTFRKLYAASNVRPLYAGIIHDLRNSLVLGVCNNCALFKCTAEHSNFYFLAAFSCGTIHILRQQEDSGLGG